MVARGVSQDGDRSFKNRSLAFQTLTHTVSLETAWRRVLDRAHRKRHLAEYEDDLDVALVVAIIRVVRAVAERVAAR